MEEHRSNVSASTGSSYAAPQHPQNDPHLRKMYRSLFAHSPTSGMPVMVPASPLHHAAYRLESPVDLHQQYMRQQLQPQNKYSTAATHDHQMQQQQQQQGEEETSGQDRPRRRGRTQLVLQPLRRRYQKAMQQQNSEQGDRTDEGFVTGPLDMDSEIGSSTSVHQRGANQESSVLEESGASAVTNPKQSDGIMDASMSPTFTALRRHSIAGSTPVTPSTLFGFHHMKFHESPSFSPLPISGRYYSPVSPLPISSPPGTIKLSSTTATTSPPLSANSAPGFLHRPAHPYHQRSPQHPFVMYPYPSFATSPYSYYPYPAPPYHAASPYMAGGYSTSRANNNSGGGSNPASMSSQQSQETPMAVGTAAAAAAGGASASIEAPAADTTAVSSTGKTRKPRTREPHARPSHPGQCGNCGSTDTPMWRRSRFNKGVILCNKCGLYEARTGRDRPMLKRKPIKRRKTSAAQSDVNEKKTQSGSHQAQPQQQNAVNVVSLPPPAPSLTRAMPSAQEGEAVSEGEMKDTKGTAPPADTSQESPAQDAEMFASLTDDAKLMLQDQDLPHGPQQQKQEPTVTSTQDPHVVPSSHS